MGRRGAIPVRNIWRLFVDDLKRLGMNMVTAIIVIGLVVMPSIFSWYNIIGCWDVFANTGNLEVAVANADEGYTSDLMPLRINIGEQLVSSLRANDQLDWVFVDADEAVDGAMSGEYYAAVVIPASFSRDMMTFYSQGSEHSSLEYYTNEKKNAVAPKITGRGADQVSYQVNKVFSETISETALGLASALSDYVDTSDAKGRIGIIASRVNAMSGQMTQASSVLRSYAQIMDAAQALVGDSTQLLEQAQGAVADVGRSAQQGDQASSGLSDVLKESSASLRASLKQSSADYDTVASDIESAFSAAKKGASDASSRLQTQADEAQKRSDEYRSAANQLAAVAKDLPDGAAKDSLAAAASRINGLADAQAELSKSLSQSAADIAAGADDAQEGFDKAKQQVDSARESAQQVDRDFEENVEPALDDLADSVSATVSTLKGSAGKLADIDSDLTGATDSVQGGLRSTKEDLLAAADDVDGSAARLSSLSQALSTALANDDAAALKAAIGSDPEAIASVLSAPVKLDRHEVFPAENFGSQMAPLYSTLGLWIGSLLLAVAIKVVVSKDNRKNLADPKPRELFLGRFGVFALLSLAQSTIMAVGNLVFLKVQAVEPLLYLICFWAAGLVFTLFIYSLVVSFANLGKGIAVFFLIIQVTAGGGSFPLQMLPDFFQQVSPYVPATHVINAMRAAMMGVYQGDFWVELAYLLPFAAIALLLGLALRKPFERFMRWYVKKVEASKLAA